MRVLYPTSKKGTSERADSLLVSQVVKPQHIYRTLDILAEESDFSEETVYKNSLQVVN